MSLYLSIVISMILTLGCSSLSKSQFKLRDYSELQLSNGLRVTLIPDQKLPYFTLNLLVKSGSLADPQGKAGVANLAAALLDQGTKTKTALRLADELEQKGSEFGASVSNEYTRITGTSLSLYKDELLSLFSDMLQNPAYSVSEIRRYKQQTISSLKKTVDNPGSLTRKAYGRYIFTGHDYGKNPVTVRSISSIKRSDLVKFHKKHYNADNTNLYVVGKFGPNIKLKLEKAFGGLESGVSQSKKLADPVKPKGRQILLVTKKDLKQSQVAMGHPSIFRNHPDYLKLQIAGTILGRGFSSRLLKEIRVKRGLTYSIGAYFNAQKSAGSFNISTFSRNEKAAEIVRETLKVVDKFVQEGITEEELSVAQGLLKGGFPRLIETPEDLANNMQLLNFMGVGVDYLKNYQSRISSYSVADINKAIKKHMSAQNIKIVVFAPYKTSHKALTAIGQVQTRSYREYLK